MGREGSVVLPFMRAFRNCVGANRAVVVCLAVPCT